MPFVSWPGPLQGEARLQVVPIFLRDSRESETRARVKIIPRQKGETRLVFLAWDFSWSKVRLKGE